MLMRIELYAELALLLTGFLRDATIVLLNAFCVWPALPLFPVSLLLLRMLIIYETSVPKIAALHIMTSTPVFRWYW